MSVLVLLFVHQLRHKEQRLSAYLSMQLCLIKTVIVLCILLLSMETHWHFFLSIDWINKRLINKFQCIWFKILRHWQHVYVDHFFFLLALHCIRTVHYNSTNCSLQTSNAQHNNANIQVWYHLLRWQWEEALICSQPVTKIYHLHPFLLLNLGKIWKISHFDSYKIKFLIQQGDSSYYILYRHGVLCLTWTNWTQFELRRKEEVTGSKTANEYYLKVTFFEKDLTQDVRDACGPSADSQTVRKWSQWKGGWREAIPQ